MLRNAIRALTASTLTVAALSAHASLTYDANVTNAVIYGSGNANGGFTVDTQSNVELGLRAHVRYPTPLDTFNSNGAGTYSFATGGYGGGAKLAGWNFDFSINSDASGTSGLKLSALTYVLGIDTDASQGVNFTSIDPAALILDSAFGDNTTGTGVSGATPRVVGDGTQADTSTLLAQYNLMQNSENLGWFDPTFDPTANGTYSFYLAAFNDAGQQVARTNINVVVGQGGAAVPEPASIALVGVALLGAGFARRRVR
jgi:hypothetical protein